MNIHHLDKQTVDGTAQNLGALYQLFPSCFTEMKDGEGNLFVLFRRDILWKYAHTSLRQ